MKRLLAFLSILVLAFSVFCASAEEEAVLRYDEEAFSIAYLGIEFDEVYGSYLKFSLTNHTENAIMVSIDIVILDGILLEPFFADMIDAGETGTEQIVIEALSEPLEGREITSVVLDLWIYDAENGYDSDLFHDTLEFMPFGKSGVSMWERPSYEDEILLQDDNFVRIYLNSITTDPSGDILLDLFLENKSSRNLIIRVRNANVNGSPCSPYFSCKLKKNTSVFASLTLPDVWKLLELRQGANHVGLFIEEIEQNGSRSRTLKRVNSEFEF